MSDVEPDAVADAPHPRMTLRLCGQEAAEAEFLAATQGARAHHAWLITGPRGVGKATLAWRIARFLLARRADAGVFGADPPATLDVNADDPVARQVAALSHPGLFLMRRTAHPETGRMRDVITIDTARALKQFLALSAPDDAERVVIVDAADELNVAAANAILKLLEEPPARVTFLLVCHSPARLLPTVRSRCRVLRCTPLSPPDLAAALTAAGHAPGDGAVALAELSAGSAGMAARLMAEDGVALYAAWMRLVSGAPGLDRADLWRLAADAGGRSGAARWDVAARLIEVLLARLARAGAGRPPDAEIAEGEAGMLARLAPDAGAGRAWAALSQRVSERLGHGRAVNLDPSALLLDTGLAIDRTAADIV